MTSINERGFAAHMLERGTRSDYRVAWSSVWAMHDADLLDLVAWTDEGMVRGRGAEELAEVRRAFLEDEPVSGVVAKLPAGWRLFSRAAVG